MDNFDLKKYLVENNVTINSKILKENQKTQSPIEWLEEKLKISFGDEIKPLRGFFVQAKEMEEQQHRKTAEYWANRGKLSSTNDNYKGISFEQWYNETYGE
jgi:hypothetical protein